MGSGCTHTHTHTLTGASIVHCVCMVTGASVVHCVCMVTGACIVHCVCTVTGASVVHCVCAASFQVFRSCLVSFGVSMKSCFLICKKTMKLLLNGRFYNATRLHVTLASTAQVVVCPEHDGSSREIHIATANGSQSFEVPTGAPKTLFFDASSLWVTFEEDVKQREDDSVTLAASYIVMKHLEKGKGKPKIGAVSSRSLEQLLEDELGADRMKQRSGQWWLDREEIANFKVDDDTAVVAKVGKKAVKKDGPSVEPRDFGELIQQAQHARHLSASFSTMMRYFHKAKADFCWHTDEETVIQVVVDAKGR